MSQVPVSDARLGGRMLQYIGAHKRLFAVALMLYPISALSVVVPPYLVQQMLDVAIPKNDMGYLQTLALIYLLALVIDYISGFASQFAMSVLGQRAMRTMRGDLFRHVQKLPTSYFDKNPIGRTLTRLTNDVEALADVFSTGAVTVIADIVTVIAILASMFWMDVRLAGFAMFVVPPLMIATLLFQRVARRAFRAIRKHLTRINSFLSEHLSGMSVVQIFGQQDRTNDEFRDLNIAYRDANHRAILVDASLFAFVQALGTIAVSVLIWFGAGDLAGGLVGAGILVAFIQYIRRLFIPIRDLSGKYTLLQSGFAAAERIFELFDEPITLDSKPDPVRVKSFEDAIEFENVSFAYTEDENGKNWVLEDINLKVRRGERVALVGATGSGKTTIIKLLNRFYDVQKGRVSVDGHDVRDVHLGDLRRLFAVVLQDVYLFAGSVMDNLALKSQVTPESVREAAGVVQATPFIERLPNGYDTAVHGLGSNFSAGERQLLAFARALALNPEILVLDEATSNVDSETEFRLQAALDILLENRTAIVVAHRLSTVRKVDRIIVLQHGEIAEEGSHEDLMHHGGIYRDLVELQFGAPN